jgi:hypothetical protein
MEVLWHRDFAVDVPTGDYLDAIGTPSIVDSSAIVISRSSTTSFMICSLVVRGNRPS